MRARSPITVAVPRKILTCFPLSSLSGEHGTHFNCTYILSFIARPSIGNNKKYRSKALFFQPFRRFQKQEKAAAGPGCRFPLFVLIRCYYLFFCYFVHEKRKAPACNKCDGHNYCRNHDFTPFPTPSSRFDSHFFVGYIIAHGFQEVTGINKLYHSSGDRKNLTAL